MIKQEYAIDVSGLSKSFNKKMVVDNVSIKVPYGQVYGFLGPNGSGKTTTIRMLCGLLTADSGKGTCLGYDVFTQGALIRDYTGYMTQKFSYWEDLTVKENLRFIADIYGIKNDEQYVEEVIHHMGLEKYRDQLTGNLSGGWKQRMALAACTLHKPRLLLLDEPTAGVDPKARREFWDEIHKLAASGLTVLVSTHYMDEAERCHKIIYISGGKVIVEGTTEQVIAQAGLTTWVVTGGDLSELQQQLDKYSDIIDVTSFGNGLHISGVDSKNLAKIIAPYTKNPNYEWQLIKPSMEDAFIHYMNNAKLGEKL